MKRFKREKELVRKLRNESSRFRVNLELKKWCDLWHTHFDWEGDGDAGWAARQLYLNALFRALNRARVELTTAPVAVQLFVSVCPRSSADDALYVHTANPNSTEFPFQFADTKEVDSLPPWLSRRINRDLYRVLKTSVGDYVVLARFR